MIVKKILAVYFLLISTVCAFAQFSGDGFGSSGFSQSASAGGFLANCTGQFVPTNYAPNSNDFVPADGFWSAENSTAALPTVTTVSDTLPDGTTGNVSKAVIGATTSGTTQYSVLYYNDTHLLGPYPLVHQVWAKVVSGPGPVYLTISRASTFFRAAISSTSWTLVTATSTPDAFGANQVSLQIGLNQFDQQSADSDRSNHGRANRNFFQVECSFSR